MTMGCAASRASSVKTESAAAAPLHDDMLAAILSRLPPRSVATSRSVCAAWRALVDERGLLLPPHAAAGEEEEDGSDEEEVINWVEMPREYLHWVLAKKRETYPVPTLEDFGMYTQEDIERKDADGLIRQAIASLQAGEDDFFEYQAWVREVYTRNGRVMIPEDVLGPKDQLQQKINEYLYKEDGDSKSEEVALPSK